MDAYGEQHQFYISIIDSEPTIAAQEWILELPWTVLRKYQLSAQQQLK